MKKRFMLAPPEKIDDFDLKHVSRELTGALKDILIVLWPDESFYNFKWRVDRYIGAAEIHPDDILSCWEFGGADDSISDLKVRYFYACLYYRGALKAFDKNNNEKAFSLLSHALHSFGFLEGYYEFIKQAGFSIKGPSSGGQELKLIRGKVVAYLVELLKCPPEEGWGTHEDTSEKLEEKIKNFIDSKNFGLVIKSVDHFIKKNLKDRGVAREAYLHNKQKQNKSDARAPASNSGARPIPQYDRDIDKCDVSCSFRNEACVARLH